MAFRLHLHFSRLELFHPNFLLIGLAVKGFYFVLFFCSNLQRTLPIALLSNGQFGTFGGRNDDHPLILLSEIHIPAQLEAISKSDVLEWFVLLHLDHIIDPPVDFINLLVNCYLLGRNLLHLPLHLGNLALDVGLVLPPDPLDHILLRLLHIVDAFEDVGYVVDSAFLHSQHLNCLVEIDGLVF